MAINITDLHHLEKFKIAVVAHWEPVDVPASTDPEAKAFSPPLVDLRPVLYLPVKRRASVDTFPSVRLHVQLVEAELRRLNFNVPSLVGAEVKVDVANLFVAFSGASHMSLASGHLDADLKCDVPVSPAQVKQFLDPTGPMRGRLNENLFSAIVEVPAVQLEGAALQGTSDNRVFFYRKKSVAFLPGVFGSQFQVDQGDGKVDAFPSFLDNNALSRTFGSEVFQALFGINISQRIGVLECDATGEPILPAFKPKLLRFLGQVYDTFDKLRDARKRRLFSVPEAFLVYDLRLFAYDWRVDLTQAASEMMDRLRLLRQELQSKPDTDDQIALAGHSTGGVIIRKMLGEPGADALISHAFFLNVPFRGAPKALSVFITGCDPPGGDPMIPFISASSLRNIAACAPIVYHLAPSFAFPTPVAGIPGGIPAGPDPAREREKAAFIDAALERGIYFLRHVVAAAPSDIATRAKIARRASDWGDLIDDASIHVSGRAAYVPLAGTPAAARFSAFIPDLIADRDLGFQQSMRQATAGWNTTLAAKARQFHQASEAIAASGAWAGKAFIFYSKGHPTTGRVVISSRGEQDCGSNVVALIRPNNSVNSELSDGVAHPELPASVNNTLQVEQWTEDSGDLRKKFWTVSAVAEDGDGTVPLRSLLGFGGPAKVFQALPGNPKHVPAPNSDWLWDRVMELLQGFDVSGFFQSADTTNGLET